MKGSRPRIEAFTQWQLAPDLVSPEEHATVCNQGFIEVQNGLYEQLLPCPVCEAAKSQKERQEAAKLSLLYSGIPARYLDLTWDDLELLQPFRQLKERIAHLDRIIAAGHSLVLQGPSGSGKTTIAMLAAKEALSRNFGVRVINLGRKALELRAAYDTGEMNEHTVVKELSSIDLLVLDDLGAGETGEAKIERRLLYLVAEARQNARRSTIVTTNLPPPALASAVGVRIMHRLEPLATITFDHGRNFRRPKGKTLWESA